VYQWSCVQHWSKLTMAAIRLDVTGVWYIPSFILYILQIHTYIYSTFRPIYSYYLHQKHSWNIITCDHCQLLTWHSWYEWLWFNAPIRPNKTFCFWFPTKSWNPSCNILKGSLWLRVSAEREFWKFYIFFLDNINFLRCSEFKRNYINNLPTMIILVKNQKQNWFLFGLKCM